MKVPLVGKIGVETRRRKLVAKKERKKFLIIRIEVKKFNKNKMMT